MGCSRRIPEDHTVDGAVLDLFSRVSAWGARAAAGRVARVLGSRLRSGARLLDVGTGPGTIPLDLKRRVPGLGITGLDIDPGMLQRAGKHRARAGVSMHLVAGDARRLPFADSSFDVVSMFFALHHVDNPGAFIAEADRVLKEGGHLLVIDFRRDMPATCSISSIWPGERPSCSAGGVQGSAPRCSRPGPRER
jgi:ubiquinone/menaquinone biosynthesis C-methylase UbiE